MSETFGTQIDTGVADFNNDGVLDNGEYATTILLADKLSTGKIDGIITNEGQNKSLAYAVLKNKEVARETLQELYEQFDLEKENQKFSSNPNNLI